jgi:hypothetical protein
MVAPDQLKSKLEAILQSEFQGADVALEFASPLKKIGGHVIWSGFGDQDQADRQATLWKTIRGKIAPDDLPGVTAILTLTPAELAEITDE